VLDACRRSRSAAQVTHAIYGVLYRLAATTPRHLSPRLAPEVTRALRHAYGLTPSAAANDGIVPTRSQAWGHVLHAAIADHLDVLGHFRDASHDPPHVDWLVTGSGFDRARFEALWDNVGCFLTTRAAAINVPASTAIARSAQHLRDGRMIGTPRTTRQPRFEGFWDRPLPGLLEALGTSPTGLSSDEAQRRLRLYGPNALAQESRFAALIEFMRFFANPLVLILLVASTISITLGDPVGGLIIIAMVLLSVLLNFFMEFQARHAVEAIRKEVATTAAVVRDGQEKELPIAELVPATSSS